MGREGRYEPWGADWSTAAGLKKVFLSNKLVLQRKEKKKKNSGYKMLYYLIKKTYID